MPRAPGEGAALGGGEPDVDAHDAGPRAGGGEAWENDCVHGVFSWRLAAGGRRQAAGRAVADLDAQLFQLALGRSRLDEVAGVDRLFEAGELVAGPVAGVGGLSEGNHVESPERG